MLGPYDVAPTDVTRMTATTPDGGRADDDGEPRYAVLGVEDDGTVIYDRDNHRAWIQSDGAVLLDETA